MCNLISAGFYKIKKSRVFWAGMVLVNIWSAFLTVQAHLNSLAETIPYTFEDGLFVIETIMILLIAVFVSLFFGTEYSDGTLRNKLIGGYTRGQIYVSQFIVNAAACLLIYFSSLLVSGILGIFLMGAEGVSAMKIVVYIVAGAGMCITDAALFTFLTVSVGTKAGASVAGLLLGFSLLCGGMVVHDKLSQEEYMYIPKIVTGRIYVYSEDGAGRRYFCHNGRYGTYEDSQSLLCFWNKKKSIGISFGYKSFRTGGAACGFETFSSRCSDNL